MSKIIITGATGTAGAEALRQALLHPSISQVFVLTRRPLPAHIAPNPPSPKLTVIEHADFTSYPPSLLDQLAGADGVLWDLGISSVGFKEKEYEVITKDYALAAAKAFAGIKRDEGKEGKFVFAYLSGRGTDQNGKGVLFARVKGRAEVALANLRDTLPSLTTYSFRAGGIAPIAPVPEAPLAIRIMNRTLLPAFNIVYPSIVNRTDNLARAMIEAVLRGGSGEIDEWKGKGLLGNEHAFESGEINVLAKDSVLSKSA